MSQTSGQSGLSLAVLYIPWWLQQRSPPGSILVCGIPRRLKFDNQWAIWILVQDRRAVVTAGWFQQEDDPGTDQHNFIFHISSSSVKTRPAAAVKSQMAFLTDSNNLHFHEFQFASNYIFTCSAWRIFREAREGVHGCEAGAHRLHPTLVNGKVNIARSAGLQYYSVTLQRNMETEIMSRTGEIYNSSQAGRAGRR